MDVIHFTHGSADPLSAFDAKRVSFVPLAEGNGASHVSCAHAKIEAPSGMGCIFKQAEPYSLLSEAGAIILIVEAEELAAHVRGISTPERIAGAGWPSDAVSTFEAATSNEQ